MRFIYSSLVTDLSSNLCRGGQNDWAVQLSIQGICILNRQLVGLRKYVGVLYSYENDEQLCTFRGRKCTALVGPQSYSKLPLSCEGEYSSPEPADSTRSALCHFWVLWWFTLIQSVRVSILGSKWTKIHINLIGIYPSYPFLAGEVSMRYCFFTAENWLYLHKINTLTYKPPFSLLHFKTVIIEALKITLKYTNISCK